MRRGSVGVAAIGALALAGCAAPQTRTGSAGGGRYYDSRLGVYSSPRLVADGEAVPRGGGSYLVGRPYTIGGRAYYPSERPDGYVAVGTASWYGDAFHGRRTANGEIFDKNSITAAHPTLPLPSYVRVTNAGNGRSIIVRVNDRGPYHGGRVMDVSQRVAEALSFKLAGTARIKVEYVGRAGLRGSDDDKLLATLRMDGGPAQLDGAGRPTMLAGDDSGPLPGLPLNSLMAATDEPRPPEPDPAVADASPVRIQPRRRLAAPVPPQRPYDVSEAEVQPTMSAPSMRSASRPAVPSPTQQTGPPKLVSFAPVQSGPSSRLSFPPPTSRPAPTDAQAEY